MVCAAPLLLPYPGPNDAVQYPAQTGVPCSSAFHGPGRPKTPQRHDARTPKCAAAADAGATMGKKNVLNLGTVGMEILNYLKVRNMTHYHT